MCFFQLVGYTSGHSEGCILTFFSGMNFTGSFPGQKILRTEPTGLVLKGFDLDIWLVGEEKRRVFLSLFFLHALEGNILENQRLSQNVEEFRCLTIFHRIVLS